MTRGHAVALAAVRTMIVAGAPHALLLVGPASVGKATLAFDLAAGLLCVAPEPGERPCRACRGCRLVASGNHPDLHVLRPGGAGHQIKIQATAADPRPGVRELIDELALLPVEGGPRIAIVESAQRMNEDAQNALLKLLEEPADGIHFVLCADDEDRLLPTIRSRCRRLRLGTVAGRDIETWLADAGIADPPTAARVARLAGGRPGRALAYALAPAAIQARTELDRTLIDLLDARPAVRLATTRRLLARAAVLDAALAPQAGPLVDGSPTAGSLAPAAPGGGRPARQARGRRTSSAAVAGATATSQDAPSPPAPDAPRPADDPEPENGAGGTSKKASPAERRRSALMLLEIWRELALDLVRAGLGDRRRLHDPRLLEEIEGLVARLPAGAAAGFLERLDRAARAVEGNASPELAVDVLALAWPHPAVAA